MIKITLERWVNSLKRKWKWSRSVNVQLFATPWTVTHQAPPSMEFSRQEYWIGLPFPSLGIFPTEGLNPGILHCRQMLYPLNHRDPVSIPGWERSPGEGNGNPLQYSCLENPMDRGAWWVRVHGVAKSGTQLRDFTFTFFHRVNSLLVSKMSNNRTGY